MNKPIGLEEALKLGVVWVETRSMLVEAWNDECESYVESIIGTLKQGMVTKEYDFLLGEHIVVQDLEAEWRRTGYFQSDYQKRWRCWKDKPTVEDMNENAWEGRK